MTTGHAAPAAGVARWPEDSAARSGSVPTLLLAVACGIIAANIYYPQPLAGLVARSVGLPQGAAGLFAS